MKKNVGGIDRILRIVVGLALIAGYFFNTDATYSWLYLLGIIPLATGLMSNVCCIAFWGSTPALPRKTDSGSLMHPYGGACLRREYF